MRIEVNVMISHDEWKKQYKECKNKFRLQARQGDGKLLWRSDMDRGNYRERLTHPLCREIGNGFMRCMYRKCPLVQKQTNHRVSEIDEWDSHRSKLRSGTRMREECGCNGN